MNILGWLLLLFGLYLLLTGNAGPFVELATKPAPQTTTADRLGNALNQNPLMSPLTSLSGL